MLVFYKDCLFIAFFFNKKNVLSWCTWGDFIGISSYNILALP